MINKRVRPLSSTSFGFHMCKPVRGMEHIIFSGFYIDGQLSIYISCVCNEGCQICKHLLQHSVYVYSPMHRLQAAPGFPRTWVDICKT